MYYLPPIQTRLFKKICHCPKLIGSPRGVYGFDCWETSSGDLTLIVHISAASGNHCPPGEMTRLKNQECYGNNNHKKKCLRHFRDTNIQALERRETSSGDSTLIIHLSAASGVIAQRGDDKIKEPGVLQQH